LWEGLHSLENNIIQHRLIERLHKAHTGDFTAEERARRVMTIDEEGKTYMRHAKKICRKIKACRIPFLPSGSGGYRCTTLFCDFTKGVSRIEGI
jgi:hypothetical protein